MFSTVNYLNTYVCGYIWKFINEIIVQGGVGLKILNHLVDFVNIMLILKSVEGRYERDRANVILQQF